MTLSEFISSLTFLEGSARWIIQVFIVIFVVLFSNYFQRRALLRIQKKLEQTENIWDDTLIQVVRKPLTLLIWIVGIAFAAEIVQQETGTAIFEAVGPMRDLGVIITAVWFLVRLIKTLETNIVKQKQSRGVEVDPATADAIGKLLRASAIITGILVALQTLGFSVSGVLAFGGIGGIAIGFAAKDLLANFFGSLTIYMDRPFTIGDWIRSPDRNIEGTVEAIGWRLTRIRTFDKRPLYVPNSTFTTIVVENPSRMSHRRIYETIGIRYDDASQMSAIVDDVKKMLLQHPEIDTKQTMIVNFNAFNDSSLDFFIYTFTKTTNWIKYHEIKHDVLLKVYEVIIKHNADIAFPTQTVHVPNTLQFEGLK